MTNLWQTAAAALRAAMVAAWPETIGSGVWDAQEALRRSFEKNMNPPYGIIDMADLPASGLWGVANRAYAKEVGLYYVSEMEGDSEAVMAKLMALNDYLDTARLGNPMLAQLIPVNLTPACGGDLPPNSLLILLNATQQAGRLSGTLVAGTNSLKPDQFNGVPH